MKMKQNLHALIAAGILLASGLVACDSPEADEYFVADTNSRLETGAAALAPLLGDPALRAQLATRLAEKKTGDFEVLLADIHSFVQTARRHWSLRTRADVRQLQQLQLHLRHLH